MGESSTTENALQTVLHGSLPPAAAPQVTVKRFTYRVLLRSRYLLSISYFDYVARGTVFVVESSGFEKVLNSHRFRHVFTGTKGA